MKKSVRVRNERHYRPHAEFYHAVWVHLQHVKEKRDGYYYSLLSAHLMSAFTIEAYLNYVGPTVENGWDDFDRAPVLAKLRHVASVLAIKFDEGKRPFQSIAELFRFRNSVAHPRPSKVVEERLCSTDEYQKSLYTEPRPEWMKVINEKDATRFYDDVGNLIELINSKLPKPDVLPLSDLSWHGSAKSTKE